MRFGERLQRLDSRLIYAVMIVVIAVPLIKPIGFPVKLSREAKAAFETIDAVSPGETVLIATSIFPSTQAELEPQTIAVLRHLVSKQVKIVIASCHPETPRYVDRYVSLLTDLGYEDGIDFVALPFMAGDETLYAAMGQDFKSIYAQVPQSELWDSISDIKSFKLVISISGGDMARMLCAHVGDPHGIKVVACIAAVVLASTQQFFSSGQLSGMVAGMSGAAEYEFMAKVPGKGIAGMDAQSLGHLWIISLVILGNIGYLTTRDQKEHAGGVK